MKKCTKCLEIKPLTEFYKAEALAILRNAIKSGTVIKPSHCAVCGKQSRLAAYHNDYEEPLDVLWICRVCRKGLY